MATTLAFVEMTEDEILNYENNQRSRGDAQPKVLAHLNDNDGPNTLVVEVDGDEDELKSVFGKYSRACVKFAEQAKKQNKRLSAIMDKDNSRVLVGRLNVTPAK